MTRSISSGNGHGVDLGQRLHARALLALIELDPVGTSETHVGERCFDRGEALASLAKRDHVAFADAVARDVEALAVHQEMTVAHQLTRGWNRRREAGAEDRVVEAALEELEELVTRRVLAVHGLVVEAA